MMKESIPIDITKAGCRVVVLDPGVCHHLPGRIVLPVTNRIIGIRFDEPQSFAHNLNGACESGHGWNVYRSDLLPMPVAVEITG